jgi:serine/threonine protein kinase/Tol biopolymer transport system component
MMLAAGSKLGPYEIGAPLGAGGMGEVYRARDTRLERTVAIKILPAQFSADPVRKQRFEREAKTISSLNHPHICTLHDVGSQDGVDYLVMECVEGETLAKRLEKGPLPLEHVLKIGAQIAEALEKAHRNGIVHRDLKPGNIMLTAAGAKLLDFGLAKPAVPLASLATLTATAAKKSPATAEGTIVGTFQYMSPEQVEGKELDGRSDIFSLGAVLYEMLTGQRAFDSKSQLSVASAILEKEPAPLTTIKPMTPPALEHAIKKCLAKIPEERWQSASDLSSELKWVSESGSQGAARALSPAAGKSWLRGGWLVSGVLLLLLASLGAAWWMRTLQSVRAMYFSSPVRFAANNVALSPDGKRLAMVAYAQQINKYMVWTQEIGGRIATAVPGTEDASHPFWSPDGRSVGFFAQGQLKKVEVLSGRAAQIICEAPHGRGGTWSRDGVILFSPDGHGGLFRVSSAGGTPTPATTVNSDEFSHRWPVFLPDGRHFLYLAANFSGKVDLNRITVGSLDSAERHVVVNASSNAAYADPGYLLYLRDNVLVAQRFDPNTFALSGDPRAISDDVQYSQLIDLALFDVVGTKTLVAQTGKGIAKSQLTWYERNGRPVGTVGTPDAIANPNLSPNGDRVVFDQIDRDGRNINIWTEELPGGVPTRLTFSSAADQCPVWTPDGRRVTFGSNRSFHFTLFQKNSDGSGAETQINDLGVPQQGPWDWSRDGKYLLVMKNAELWYLSSSDWQSRPFLQTKGTIRNAQFSPDGKWVAYSSNETGSSEVYVSVFSNPLSKRQISRGGGQEPRWRRDGKELFYLSADAKLMAVPVKPGATFEAGPAEVLFQTHARQLIGVMDAFSYDVTRDGQRFLINVKVDEPSPAPLSIILNWAEEVKEK